MMEEDNPSARMRALQIEVASRSASFERELALAYAVIDQLREDKKWIHAIAEERSERIKALELQLEAAYETLEALRASGKHDKQWLRKTVASFLVGVAAISQISGLTLTDLIDRPTEPLAPIIYVLEPSDLPGIGLHDYPALPPELHKADISGSSATHPDLDAAAGSPAQSPGTVQIGVTVEPASANVTALAHGVGVEAIDSGASVDSATVEKTPADPPTSMSRGGTEKLSISDSATGPVVHPEQRRTPDDPSGSTSGGN